MKKFRSHTLQEYLKALSAKSPVPGGGSAAALAGALGAGLISMVASYSKGKSSSKATEKRIKETLKKSEKIRKRLLECVDLDAQAYLKVVRTRTASSRLKGAARKQAGAVPLEVCQLCYAAIQLTPFLVKKGNKHLGSDVAVAVELLLAAFQSAKVHVITK